MQYPTLTPQEARVLACAQLLLTNWQTAERLSIREKSVENYRARIRKKLGIDPGAKLHTIR